MPMGPNPKHMINVEMAVNVTVQARIIFHTSCGDLLASGILTDCDETYEVGRCNPEPS